MKCFSKIGLLCILFAFTMHISVAQSKEELEKQRENLLKEISLANELLESTTKNRKSSFKQLLVLNRRLEYRKKLIESVEKELEYLQARIEDNENVIKSLENDLDRLKVEYEKLILSASRDKYEYSKFMYVLSAESFNQAYKRLKYYKQYTDFRKEQIKLIEAINYVLDVKIKELLDKKKEQENLLTEKEKETFSLNREKEEQQKLVVNLRQEERKLKRELEEKQKVAQRIQDAIEKLIAEEAAKSNSKYYELSPEENVISGDFENNKGGLPWPVERGVVTSSFGEHAHPVLKNIKVKNNGIDIETPKNAYARAIFEGEVKKVFSIPGANKAVIIRHGKYLTVYSNLLDVYVKEGDKVNIKENIGVVYNDPDEERSTLHIEIREQFNVLNPIDWLIRK